MSVTLKKLNHVEVMEVREVKLVRGVILVKFLKRSSLSGKLKLSGRSKS